MIFFQQVRTVLAQSGVFQTWRFVSYAYLSMLTQVDNECYFDFAQVPVSPFYKHLIKDPIFLLLPVPFAHPDLL